MSVKIDSVIKNSPAEKAGLRGGDILVLVNGREINDVIDYMYYCADKKLRVVIGRDGEKLEFEAVKGEYDEFGACSENFLMDAQKGCRNKCIFCFIDQLPKGMRDTLYFKDDDARLSFLHGNYVTLTNLSDADIDRIIEMRLNVNVSVHTTDPELRRFMMNNPLAGEKLGFLKKLSDAGITMNCQIVLCPGINDGARFEKTITDLSELSPAVNSIAAVPAGLTRYRENLYPLSQFDSESALKVIETVGKFQERFLDEYGTRLVYAADEFFLKADRPVPPEEYYEDYPQYENGVGMLRSFESEWDAAMGERAAVKAERRELSLATGESAYGFILRLIEKANAAGFGINCAAYKITNDFFGESITVSGLITGTDIISRLKGERLGEALLLSSSMIKKDTDLFLDGVTIGDAEKALGVKIKLIQGDGAALFRELTKPKRRV